MAADALSESRSQQQRFDRAGRKADEGLAGIGARLAAFRDAAAERLPFMGKRKPADASTQTFYCSGVSLAAAANRSQSLTLGVCIISAAIPINLQPHGKSVGVPLHAALPDEAAYRGQSLHANVHQGLHATSSEQPRVRKAKGGGLHSSLHSITCLTASALPAASGSRCCMGDWSQVRALMRFSQPPGSTARVA